MNLKESFKKSFKDINPLSLGVGALTGLNSAIGFNNRGAGAVAQGLSQIKTGNPFVDMGIQGASMLLNQFGYNVNEQLKNDIENNIAENNSFQSNAGDWDSFLSNYNSAPTMKYWSPDQLVKRGIFNTSGGRGLINSLAQQQAQSGNWVSNSLALNADNIIQDDINNDWRNFNNPINIGAKGGLLHTLGTEWDNGLTFINNGGTHEENPNQGVQVGVDPKGTPNLVEEGEVIWNDYVFSNRLKVPKETINKYKLGGSKKDYTYAEVVEKLQRASEERPNDPLEKRYLEEMLAMLMEEQEMIRQQQQEEEQAQQQLAMQEALQDPAVQEQLIQEQLAQENMMQENMMGLPMMAANGGELYHGISRGPKLEPIPNFPTAENHWKDGMLAGYHGSRWSSPDLPAEEAWDAYFQAAKGNPSVLLPEIQVTGSVKKPNNSSNLQQHLTNMATAKMLPWAFPGVGAIMLGKELYDNLNKQANGGELYGLGGNLYDSGSFLRRITPTAVQRYLMSEPLTYTDDNGRKVVSYPYATGRRNTNPNIKNSSKGKGKLPRSEYKPRYSTYETDSGGGFANSVNIKDKYGNTQSFMTVPDISKLHEAIPTLPELVVIGTVKKKKAPKSATTTPATTPATTIAPTSTTTATSKKAKQGKVSRKLPVGDFDLDMASLGVNPNSIYSLDLGDLYSPDTAPDVNLISQEQTVQGGNNENNLNSPISPTSNPERETNIPLYDVAWNPDAMTNLSIAGQPPRLLQEGVTQENAYQKALDPIIPGEGLLDAINFGYEDTTAQKNDEDIKPTQGGRKGGKFKFNHPLNPESLGSNLANLRFINAIASLGQVMSDAFGRTNTPDHSYANALQAAAANYPRIFISPIGDRQAYTPRDIFNTLINPLYANSAGISRNLANSGNRGTQTVQQIALDRNLADATGKAYATGVEGELASKKAVADYNANIDKINATMSMQAQQQNAANRQRYINYLAQALAWKQQEDTQAAMARAANREALANNWTTIGQNIYDANAGNAITRYQRDPNGGSIIFIG